MAWNPCADNSDVRSWPGQGSTEFAALDVGCTEIRDLMPGISNVSLVGIVLAKEEPKAIPSKKVPGSELHLLSLTLRDSPDFYINATCWGGFEHIKKLADTFRIGDIVEIGNPQVQSKPSDGRDERFRPTTPSEFCLNLSEHHSSIQLYSGMHINKFTQLLHVPIRHATDFYTLGDVLANGQSLDGGEIVNILAAVRHVSDVKEVTSKTGRLLKKCEVLLMDETCASANLTLWDKEFTGLATSWIAKEHILFLIDVRASFDSYKKRVVLSTCSKTIITTNPDTQEAYNLYQFTQSADVTADVPLMTGNGYMTEDTVELSSIKEVFNVDDLKRRFEKAEFSSTGYLYCVVYGYISKLDLDSADYICVSVRCGSCRKLISLDHRICTNIDCIKFSIGSDPGDLTPPCPKPYYSISVNISDITGTISPCLLQASAAEKLIGIPPEQFLKASDSMKTHIKWKYLLEKCKIYVKVILPSFERPKPSVRIISMSLANPQEALRFMRL